MRNDHVDEWGRIGDMASNIRIFSEGSYNYALIYMPPDVKGPAAFTTMWRGPFLVSKRLGPRTYRLRAPATGREFAVNVDNMVAYHPRAPIATPALPPPEDESDHMLLEHLLITLSQYM
jgi:hypothetical protein